MDTELSDALARMRSDWDTRAKENACYYVANSSTNWEGREFFRSGEINVANEIMPDVPHICGGQRSPLDLSVLELGCGVGRMTRMLSRIFGHVTAVDISAEMVNRAQNNLADLTNITFVVNDGHTLCGLSNDSYDFAFSFIVFQHIPSYAVIRSYCCEVFRVLKPGALFKFQVQGHPAAKRRPTQYDTWNGFSFTEKDAALLAAESNFRFAQTTGANTQYFWLWFRKPG
ncbi:MAG: class I SAM-dependent methyltransferase [Bryobacteraceae bacterium]